MSELATLVEKSKIQLNTMEDDKFMDNLLRFQAQRKVLALKERQFFAHRQQEGYFIVKQPNWIWYENVERKFTNQKHGIGYIPLETYRKPFSFWKRTLKKAIINIPVSSWAYELPNKILGRVSDFIETKSSKPSYFTIWFIANESQLDTLKLVNIDPLLVGYWIKELHGGGYCHWWAMEANYCAVLGMWGEDLEEIDMALLKGEK